MLGKFLSSSSGEKSNSCFLTTFKNSVGNDKDNMMAEASLMFTFLSFSATTAFRDLPVSHVRCCYYLDGLFNR